MVENAHELVPQNQPTQEPRSPTGPTYCYSADEERYRGDFDTEAQALAEARDSTRPGATVWVAEVHHPMDFLKPEWVGNAIYEYVAEQLHEEVGEVAEVFVMTPEQEKALGTLVLNWIAGGPGFNCWGAKNPRQFDANTEGADK